MTAVRQVALFAGLCVGLAAFAADPPAGDLKARQGRNAERFRLIKDQLLKLSQKLAVSDKPAERERAKVILAALDVAKRDNLADELQKLAADLGATDLADQKLDRAIAQDGVLLKSLQDMLALLLSDDEAMRTRAEIKRTEAALKELRGIVRDQETVRVLTDAQKADAAKLAKQQADLAERAKALAESMAGKKAKPGDPKDGNKGQNDKKPGDPKDGKSAEGKDSKGSDPKDAKQKDGKASDPKDGKQKDGKGSDPKDGKPSDAKGSEPKDGKSAEGKPKDSQGKRSDDKQTPPSDQPQGGEQPPQPDAPQMPGRQRIEQAIPQQKGASDDLKEQKKPDATKKQDKALDELNKAVQELEKRLKQLREEEAMRQLAGLEARCAKMLQLQTAVYEATKAIDAGVQKAGGKKDTPDYQKAQAQADREREIVTEADKTLDLIKAEGSAVAFAGVLQEVREDMASVQQRLTGADVGAVTQEVESNVIALLKEMVAALKKQQQDMQKQQQQQQQNPQSGPQPNQELANKIAQLKLIRSMQTIVNSRTRLLGAQEPGEQTGDAQRAADLRALAARQVKIQEMMTALATGANQ